MAVGQRASFCVATNDSHGVDVARCVPPNEHEWWDRNLMDRYGRSSMLPFSTQSQDSPANLVPLRSDFHRVFDERHLCFAPKVVDGSDFDDVDERDLPAPATSSQPPRNQTRLLIHVVVPSPNGQVAGLWHNRGLHAFPPGLSKECLFARFAYTILSPAVFSSTFLSGTRVSRCLRVWEPVEQITNTKILGSADCRRIARTVWSRHSGDGDEGGCEVEGGLLAQFDPDPAYATNGDEEERGRGRKRVLMS